ncbi:MAG: acyl carrier protein [Hyphomonadaceae bacterium]
MTTVTEDELLDIIAKEAIVDRATLTRDATLEAVGIASLDIISVLFEIEERYNVKVEEGDLPLTATLGEMTDFLLAKINAQTETTPSHG